MSKKNDEAIKIAEEIIKNIEANPYTVSNIRKFFRLVDMLKIENEIEWVQRELYDYKDLNDCPGYRRVKSDKNKVAHIGQNYEMLKIYMSKEVILSYYPFPENPHIVRETIRVTPYDFLNILKTVDNELDYVTLQGKTSSLDLVCQRYRS